jgi:hypothetical protein
MKEDGGDIVCGAGMPEGDVSATPESDAPARR